MLGWKLVLWYVPFRALWPTGDRGGVGWDEGFRGLVGMVLR